MNLGILFRSSLIVQGLVLLGYVHTATCNKFFFNSTSQIQITTGVIPLQHGFDFSFSTCKGGALLSQRGTNNGFFLLEVVPTIVNYSSPLTPLFTQSHLKMTWNVNGVTEFITLGTDLDRNYKHTVQFTPGSGVVNSTLRLNGITSFSVDVPNNILGFSNSGPLNAGSHITGGEGFVGCIESGTNIQLTDLGIAINIKRNCSVTCPPKVCRVGYTGYYCQVNIDDCAQAPCHHNSTCIDLIGDYRCSCGPRWTGQHCDHFLGTLCNATICKNNGVCQDTYDKNNYTCICQRGYTGRNCETQFNPCDSSPCEHGGNCSKLTVDDFQCACPPAPNSCLCGQCVNTPGSFHCNCGQQFTGERCELDVDECSNTSRCSVNVQQGICLNFDATTRACGQPGFKCFCYNGFHGLNCEFNVDDCLTSPCKNGATCTDGITNYTCTCAAGWTGRHCDVDINECDYGACQNEANCTNLIGTYSCSCVAGYTDFNCSTNIDECEPNPCVNGNCTDLINDFNCSCIPGFEGKNCSKEIDECDPNPCINGTCQDLLTDFNCTCPADYTGKRCEIKISSCEPDNPCLNSGICILQPQAHNYTCDCAAGFNGTHCENNIDDCSSHGCNNGTCIDGVNDYTCSCNPGFTGQACDADVNECVSPNPCRCGHCVNTPGSFHCNCGQQFTGERCELDVNECSNTSLCSVNFKQGFCLNFDATTRACGQPGFKCFCEVGFFGFNCEVNVDDCLSSPCKNGANCTDDIYNYTCTCAAGWTGRHCDVDINECDYGVCQNEANCTNLDGTYSCSCVAGYADFNCSTNIDECEPNPCVNGNCTDLINDFNCSCFPGFEGFRGKTCNVNINECLSSPCGQGSCIDGINNYTCNCTGSGFTGPKCSEDIDECNTTNPCHPNATCINHRGTYQCDCQPGFTGKNCYDNIDDCGSVPCQNGGM